MPRNVDVLFLKTLADLQKRVEPDNPYEVLGASALLRKLLLDSAPLVDQVNRGRRLKIEYEIGRWGGPPAGPLAPVVYTVQDGIDPDAAPPVGKIVRVKRDQLLKELMLVAGEHEYTLREIILFEANVMGGVHAGSPETEKEEALQRINGLFLFGGYAASLRQLKAIGRVVLKSLEPLKAAIEQESKSQT